MTIIAQSDWATNAAALVNDWDAIQQWSDPNARQVQEAEDGRRAVELLRQALLTLPGSPSACGT